MIGLFATAIFVSAGLVFLVQPMTAKMLLPTFGGSPQVWTAAMLFFQAALLAGYAWADLSVRRFGRRQPLVHVVLLLLPLLVLPIGLRGLTAAGSLPPAIAVVAILGASVGAPYVAVSATSPLLQRWFSATGHRAARDPYFLYAAGNVGSLLGLLGYPILIEPRLPVGGQAVLWSVGYVVFAVLCATCAFVLARRAPGPGTGSDDAAAREPDDVPAEPISRRRRLGWLLRAFIPSSLMLGVTTYSATDVAAVPLLWAIPLSIYLVTFVLAFARRRPVSVAGWERLLPIATVLVILTMLNVLSLPIWARLAVHYAGFLVAAMVAHTQLADDRPSPAHLTGFYLIVALGGVLGGLFNAIVAPLAFDAVLEYPIVLVAALLLRRARAGVVAADATPADGTTAAGAAAAARAVRRSRRLDLLVPFGHFMVLLVAIALAARVAPTAGAATLVLALGVVATLAFARRPVRLALAVAGVFAIVTFGSERALFADRTFFGLNRVISDGERHVYVNGSTVHGIERWDATGWQIPLGYYHPSGPAGQVFALLEARTTAGPATAESTRVAVVGLGAGSLAAYGQPGERMDFVEIDPVVIDIARDPRLFRYVSESRADVQIHEADGRLWLAGAPDGAFDLIVLDAFSSDGIPAHLVTREALELYATKLGPGGRLLFHVSNHYLDVRSVVAGGALAAGLDGLYEHDADLSTAPAGDKRASEWVVVAPDPAALDPLRADGRWTPIAALDRRVVWTDDFSDILSVLR